MKLSAVIVSCLLASAALAVSLTHAGLRGGQGAGCLVARCARLPGPVGPTSGSVSTGGVGIQWVIVAVLVTIVILGGRNETE